MRSNLICATLLLPLSAGCCFKPCTYLDRKNDFLHDTGSQSLTGALPDVGRVSGGSMHVGTINYKMDGIATSLFIGGQGEGGPANGDWTPLLPGADVALSGNEDLDITNDKVVHAMGFDFVQPAGSTASTFEITLKHGTSTVGSFTFSTPPDIPANKGSFVGVRYCRPFDRLEIREIKGDDSDQYFGQVYGR